VGSSAGSTDETWTELFNRAIRRRQFLAGAGSAIFVGATGAVLDACGLGNSTQSTAGGVRTISLAHDQASWKDYYQAVSDAASKSIGVQWKQIPFGAVDVFRATLLSEAATHSVPDTFGWFTGFEMKAMAAPGYLEDLSSIWEAESAGFSAGLRSIFSYNGKAVAAPLLGAPWIIYYNKQIFSKYNLNPPTSLDDFEQLLPKLKSAGVIPLGGSVDWATAWPQSLIVATDAQLWTDLMANRAKWTDSRIVDAMNIWRGWLEKGYFPPDPSSVHYGGPNGNSFASMFVQNKVAMTAMATWYGPSVSGFTAGTDFDGFIMPSVGSGGKKGIVVETAALCVGHNGQHKSDALAMAKFFMSKQGYETWIKASGNTSVRTDVPSTSPVDAKIVKDMSSGGYTAVDRIFEATPLDIALAANDEWGKFILKPGDPMPTLQRIQAKADQVWATNP